MEQPKFSVVVPAYNEEEVLPHTHKRLTTVMEGLGSYEIIYVNDGSRDNTLSILKELAEKDAHVVAVDFSRNFGQQAAVTAGMHAARGRAVILIDADLQDPPETIPKMVERWRAGADVVYGKRKLRKGETFFKKITSKLYYRVFRFLSGSNAPLDTGDFRLMDRKVVDEINAMTEHNRYVRGMISWVGFRQEPVEFIREEREYGETKYGVRQMVRLAIDGIVGFSLKPLTITIPMGLVVAVASLIALIVELALALCGRMIPLVYPLLTGLFLFVGLLFVIIGILGGYIGRIYDEAKERPNYIINEIITQEERA